ncbi:CoA transferase subunit A [Bacillus massiliigorillae]|uniref:CoA transferase subunit A n=1 Tax=Bacillus massiliigorillae TaxID=1243664 RepID=UPI0003A77A7C|nr:CoA transferase subunit A [Bacillus massiliigorillae]
MENLFGKVVSLNTLTSFFSDEMSIMYGGFGGIGTPPTIVDFVLELGVENLTLIGNDTGFPEIGIGKLVTEKRAKKLIVSHIGSNPNAGIQMTNGEVEIEFSPQGILMERIRAGGSGIKGFLSDIGVDHEAVRLSKPIITLNEEQFLLETALTADVSIIYAKAADEFGNVIYDKSARNTNPLVAMAGDVTIVEAEKIVSLGEFDPEEIITPGIYVDYIVQSKGVNWKWAWEKI